MQLRNNFYGTVKETNLSDRLQLENRKIIKKIIHGRKSLLTASKLNLHLKFI
jgi:hypothetical protein